MEKCSRAFPVVPVVGPRTHSSLERPLNAFGKPVNPNSCLVLLLCPRALSAQQVWQIYNHVFLLEPSICCISVLDRGGVPWDVPLEFFKSLVF